MNTTMSIKKSILNLNWSWHSIRQNHDCCNYYSGSFEEIDNDIFFYHLNEIEPAFQESCDGNLSLNDSLATIDPRTNKIIRKLIEDYSDESARSNKIDCAENFNTQSVSKTKLNKSTQKTRIRPKKKCEMVIKLASLQSFEHRNLQTFIISKYMENLETQSKEISRLTTSYSLQTAIPFGGLNHKITSYDIQCNFTKVGYVPEYLENFKFSSIFNLNMINPATLSSQSKRLNNFFEFPNETDVYISENTLQIFMSSLGILETWEVPFEIKIVDNQPSKKIVFGNPFPLRSPGNFVFVQTLEDLIHSSMQQESSSSDMSLSNGLVKQNKYPEALEVKAVDLNRKYRIEICDEYLQRIFNGNKTKDSTKTNIITRKWTMRRDNGKVDTFKLITDTSIPYFKLRANEPVFLNASFNIVSNNNLIDEPMSRNELIKAWLKLFFMPSGYTKRVLLDAINLKQLTVKDLSMKDIESELLNLYNLQPSDFLGSLYSLLEIISDFPEGDYMLKFNPKYSDKLLVFVETAGNDPNKINISEMYENIHVEAKAPLIFDYTIFEGDSTTPVINMSPVFRRCSNRKAKLVANRPRKRSMKKQKNKYKLKAVK